MEIIEKIYDFGTGIERKAAYVMLYGGTERKVFTLNSGLVCVLTTFFDRDELRAVTRTAKELFLQAITK